VLAHHYEFRGRVAASASQVFEHLDEHARLASHMTQSSWKTGGGQMTIEVDERAGKAVGSHIRLSGGVLGIRLCVEEVVIKREAPLVKIWETIGTPKLLVVGRYRMGFDVVATGTESMLRVFIDYALPEERFARLLGLLLGRSYAKWCTRQMVRDAAAHFAQAGAAKQTGAIHEAR
jgi:hypothetical protein